MTTDRGVARAVGRWAAILASAWLTTAAAAATATATEPGQPATAIAMDSMARRTLACTACHGDQGRSRPDGYVPRLAGKPADYLMAQLVAFRDGRRRHQTMAIQLAALDDRMLAALAAHFAAQSVPYPAPTQPPPPATDAARARQLIEAGDPARRLPACAACHGTALTGVQPHVPGLLGLPADYIVGQLGAWRTGHRIGPAPDCMREVAQRLPDEDIARLARWLAAQPVPGSGTPAAAAPGPWPIDCGRVSR